MDEGCNEAVNEFFVKLYEDGYIYRGNRIINWCPDCKTSLSDAEVDHEETGGHFYHIKYKIENSNDFVEIATTRPETMLGDTAVAVNPNDERYKSLIGKNVILPILDRVIPVVADEYVDMEFGTGVVKITPCHDPNDFEVGQRHNLEQILVMNEDGTMNENAGKYQGMDRYECRKQIIEDLKKIDQLVKLHLIVQMRSMDAVWGYRADYSMWDYLMDDMVDGLQDHHPDIVRGDITFQVANLHVYPRHFDLLEREYQTVEARLTKQVFDNMHIRAAWGRKS